MENFSAKDDLLAFSIGEVVLAHLEEEELLRSIVATSETKALQALEDIFSILDDDTLDDPECFQRIAAIIRVFQGLGIYSLRHDP